jgi:hypothetical protein
LAGAGGRGAAQAGFNFTDRVYQQVWWQPSTGKWQKVLIDFHFLSPEVFYYSRLLEKPGHASLKTNKNIYATDTHQRPVRQGAQR